MSSTAAEIRARLKASRTIPVTLPGTDLVIDCCQPDLLTLATRGFMTWPALQAVKASFAEIEQSSDGTVVADNRPVASVLEHAKTIGAFMDEWVCAAAVSPRVVMKETDVTDPDQMLWIDDLSLEFKTAIVTATMPRTPPAVAEFRRDESPGAAPGSSGEAVRDAPVDAVVGA